MDAAHDLEGWQPISTAPKDGRPFIGGREGAAGDVGAVQVLRSKDKWPGFYSVPGDYSAKNFTHWQPLPDPPRSIPMGE